MRHTCTVCGNKSRRASWAAQSKDRILHSDKTRKNAHLGIHIYKPQQQTRTEQNGNIKRNSLIISLVCLLLRSSSVNPALPLTNITGRPRLVRSQGMKRPQNNSTTTQSIPIPLFPISKSKGTKEKAKKKHAPKNNRKEKREGNKEKSKNISKKGEK